MTPTDEGIPPDGERDGYYYIDGIGSDGEKMDPECVSIVNAMNEIPGLVTHSSGCGHGKGSFHVWFMVTNPVDLFPLLRAIDRRYSPVPGWVCQAEITDTLEYAVVFLLKSASLGEEAYSEAEQVAKEIKMQLKRNDIARL